MSFVEFNVEKMTTTTTTMDTLFSIYIQFYKIKANENAFFFNQILIVPIVEESLNKGLFRM